MKVGKYGAIRFLDRGQHTHWSIHAAVRLSKYEPSWSLEAVVNFLLDNNTTDAMSHKGRISGLSGCHTSSLRFPPNQTVSWMPYTNLVKIQPTSWWALNTIHLMIVKKLPWIYDNIKVLYPVFAVALVTARVPLGDSTPLTGQGSLLWALRLSVLGALSQNYRLAELITATSLIVNSLWCGKYVIR